MGGGGQKSTTTTQPWAEQKPYLIEGFKEAKELYPTPIQYYPGQTLANIAPEQEMGLTRMATRAMEGSPLLTGSQQLTQRTQAGQFVNPESNPYLPYYFQRGAEQIIPQIDSQAIKAGRYGSEAWGEMRGRALGDLAAGIYAPAYEAERQRQVQASQFAPGLAAQDYGDIARLLAVGEERRALEQQTIDEAQRKYEYEQLEPWDRLGMYMQAVGGPFGSESITRGGGK